MYLSPVTIAAPGRRRRVRRGAPLIGGLVRHIRGRRAAWHLRERRPPVAAGGVTIVVVLVVAAGVGAHGLDVVVEPERLERADEVLGRDGAAVLRLGLLARLVGDEADELDGAVVGEVLGARGDLDALGDHLTDEAHEVGHRQPCPGRARGASSLPVVRRRREAVVVSRWRGLLLAVTAALRRLRT